MIKDGFIFESLTYNNMKHQYSKQELTNYASVPKNKP